MRSIWTGLARGTAEERSELKWGFGGQQPAFRGCCSDSVDAYTPGECAVRGRGRSPRKEKPEKEEPGGKMGSEEPRGKGVPLRCQIQPCFLIDASL